MIIYSDNIWSTQEINVGVQKFLVETYPLEIYSNTPLGASDAFVRTSNSLHLSAQPVDNFTFIIGS
jgi:hypothetical protein